MLVAAVEVDGDEVSESLDAECWEVVGNEKGQI